MEPRPGCLGFRSLPASWCAAALAPQQLLDRLYFSTHTREWKHAITLAQETIRELAPAAISFPKGKYPAVTRYSNAFDVVGEQGAAPVNPASVRAEWSGVIFVGDSQVREVAWQALKLLAGGAKFSYARGHVLPSCDGNSRMAGESNAQLEFSRYNLNSVCPPRGVGKYGFTAVFDEAGEVVVVHSALEGEGTEALCRRIPDARLQGSREPPWDGTLAVSQAVCGSNFFLTYHAAWSAATLRPRSLPRCLNGDGYVNGSTPRRPVLWVINGAPSHEHERCSTRRLMLPATMLAEFSAAALRRTVVWQLAGAGFTLFRPNECANESSRTIADAEREWLSHEEVGFYDYLGLTLQLAPLMADGRHFSHMWTRCNQTFPEGARLAAHLALQEAMALPVRAAAKGVRRSIGMQACGVCPTRHSDKRPAEML